MVIHPHLNISFDSSSSFFALILVAAIVLGLFLPVSGYKDWELAEEIELVSLSNGLASGSKGFIYVSLTADNTYTYRYEIDSDFGTTTSKDVQKVTEIFEEYMPELPYDGLIVMTYEQNPRFFLKEFLGPKGNIVFNRLLYRLDSRKSGGLSGEELASKQREQRNLYKSKLRRPVQEKDLAEVEIDDPDDIQD